MFKILNKCLLNDMVGRMEILAPLIAKKCEPGQFIILRVDKEGERIPLTIHDYDRDKGTIIIIYQIVGATTYKLNLLKENDYITDIVGPLGEKTPLDNISKAIVIGGGVGCAISFPIVKKLYLSGADVTSIIGFRNKDLVILENDFRNYSTNSIIMTDDGSFGRQGLVTTALEELLTKGKYDMIFAIGPLIMMKFVCKTANKYNQKVIVSMNPLMIDGTGMCGCCRLTVGGKTKFACIDGPDFNGDEVDFDEAIERSKIYKDFEKRKYEEACNLFKGVKL